MDLLGCDTARILDPTTGKETEDIRDYLARNKWTTLCPDNFERNTVLGLLKRKQWKPIFADRVVQYPGMYWNADSTCLEDPPFTPTLSSYSWDRFIQTARDVFARFSGRKIGVQLSGGVDSSLIIGLLRVLDIPYGLVGLSTERYEFRTERHVQLKLAQESGLAKLIPYEDCFPMTGLDAVTTHAYPSLSCVNFCADKRMARACNDLGIDVLLTGSGGDVVLATEVPQDPRACDWHPQIFNYSWPKEVVYAAHGVELVAFYDDPQIANGLYNLRRGHAHDGNKLWARWYFRSLLPDELVRFTYRADFWGVYVEGLLESIDTIRALHTNAYKITRNKFFHDTRLEHLLQEDLLRNNKLLYQKIESRLAMSVWIDRIEKYF